MRKWVISSIALAAVLALAGCSAQSSTSSGTSSTSGDTSAETQSAEVSAASGQTGQSSTLQAASAEVNDKSAIEAALNLANMQAEWTYSESDDAWTLSPVAAVVNPQILEQQGVSVCVPGAYVKGVDTNGDGQPDATDGTATGNLVIDESATVTSTNGQVYTAKTAPVILNTGAAGYGSSSNSQASSSYAAEGYINVSCGNRGKQDTATDADGNEYYTGDAPSCLVDQKNAARFVKYNILLGNLPGNVDYFVSTGGSGGGAHAAMFAATSNNSDFYDYEIDAGAVGVYRNDDGTYSMSVTVDGQEVELSDGAWGCIAYSAITSLAEADMALAFEYYLDPTYEFGSDFQKATAGYLAAEYKDYINGQNLKVEESQVGFDLNGDGEVSGEVALTIEYDEEKYADTRGYGGTYLDLYLAEFTENLQWYLDNLDYAEDWTWFGSDGTALSDEDVAAMTSEDKATAFLEGRYAKSSTGGMGGPGGGMGGPGGGMGGPGGGTDGPGGMGAPSGAPSGNGPGNNASDTSNANAASGTGDSSSSDASSQEASSSSSDTERSFENADVAANSQGDSEDVGTPDAGTTQAAGSKTDSSNYSSYAEMLAAYQADVAEVKAGDEYGNDIVALYNPINYIGAEGTQAPTWTRVVMGASEGDMSMLASLNMQIAWLASGTDAEIEWQWDGGHVPSEVLGNSFALCVDEMYGKHVAGAKTVAKPEAEAQTTNGDDESTTGTDLTSWVNASDISNVSFSLANAAAYRTAGAAKAIPGFDVIDYGQEDYVFGSKTADARHWSEYVLKVFEEHASDLEPLFSVG